MKGTKAFIGFALLWRDNKYLKEVENILKNNFGELLAETDSFNLPYSHYYEKEMGKGLIKKFSIFNGLIEKSKIKNIKKFCMDLERDFSIDDKRVVNIDPFYIDKEQLVVSTRKYRGNRIYIGDGVFLEFELWYHHKSFQPFLWTYLDYKDKIPFFNKVRKNLIIKD